MCHGHLDPKYQMRDMEARLKHVSHQAAPTGDRIPLLARLKTVLAALTAKRPQKGQANV